MNTTPSTVLAPPPCPAVILRPYQEACVRRVVAAYEQDRRGQELLVEPLAAGKTVIFSQIIAQLTGRYGLHALLVAHTDELLNQAAEKYRQVKPTAVIGKVGGGIHDYGGEVTVASVDTISRPDHLATLKRIGYGLVVVDEAHRSAAPKYQRILQALPEAFVLKVTATPDRLDGKPISQKPPLYITDILAMIEQGYLCDVKAIAIRTETSLDSIHTEGGDYREQELEAAIDLPERNRREASAYREHAMGRRAICFAVTVQHAHNLARALTSAGIPAATVSGETSLLERKRLYYALRTGEVNVLCNVLVLTEGFDLALVDCGSWRAPPRAVRCMCSVLVEACAWPLRRKTVSS
jgi:superfamily II DNA or RNA helicase